MQHKCIKCKSDYIDSDPDPYLCPTCLEERKNIASEIDNKFASRISEHPVRGIDTYYQAMDKARAKGRPFPNAADLGLL